ncbi:MAG: cobalamin-dependent protein, partial [Dehalococcoidia bacterium]|nr:cobalamin-dependent protein [Dehalococcoidia bacterium]
MNTRCPVRKVLLVQPPCTIAPRYTKEIQPPLGLAYVAACLEQDYDVRILDAACDGWEVETKDENGLITYGLSFDRIGSHIAEFNPDVVGVSCLFSMQHRNAHKVCQVARDVNRDILTVMGGAHPTALPDQTLQDPNVDFVVLGEGEYSTKELLDCLRDGKDFSSIDGIGFKRDGGVIVNPKTRFIADLDAIPFPARHLLPMDKYFTINLPHGVSSRYSPNTPVITSRGCPARCIFCSIHSVWGHKFRARSVDNIIVELRQLKETYGIREIQFEDDNLTFDRKRASALFRRMTSEKLDLAWTTPNGVALWRLDKELLLEMKESGCYALCLAVESGDQEFLSKTIHKPLRLDRVEELTRWIRRYGFETTAFFVVGFPNETREQLMNTFRFASALDVENAGFY